MKIAKSHSGRGLIRLELIKLLPHKIKYALEQLRAVKNLQRMSDPARAGFEPAWTPFQQAFTQCSEVGSSIMLLSPVLCLGAQQNIWLDRRDF